MASTLLNNTQQALVLYTVESIENVSDVEVNVARTFAKLTSPLIIVTAILIVFLFSPTIIIGNSLVLISIYRFKRLRTPSNYLVLSLATSDLGIGMFMPVGMYLELCGARHFISARVCLLNYGVAITLCCVSILVMVAIAVDRFTSLARPLRYNNLITHTAVERYIAVFWVFSTLVGFSPFCYYLAHQEDFPMYSNGYCSFGSVVGRPIQLFMFCAVYGPSACILLICYGYVYIVARGHARAISEVRHSLHYPHGPATSRYGLALAITTGMFLTLWLPFQTLHEFKRKDYGSLVRSAFSKEIAEEGHNPLGTVLVNKSQAMLKKLGFEILDYSRVIGVDGRKLNNHNNPS